IGILPCGSPDEVVLAFESVSRVAGAGFRTGGVFLERLVERARHVEVQVVGDGDGGVVVLGNRDCTLQRRNQKVVEEAPAPDLPDAVRRMLADSSARLAHTVRYRSVGTVEYVYDIERGEAAFLEVNTRLQVEHPVTEELYLVDLVAAMLRLANGDREVMGELAAAEPRGCAVEARVYAEDPSKEYRPSPGRITEVVLPDGVRVDGWIEAGTEVTAAYDPLLAKVIAWAPTRAAALDRLGAALADTTIAGIETNLGLLGAALADPVVRAAAHTTATLAAVADPSPRIEVLRGGTQTTVQAWPGRLGYWHVGVPPSGPMDDRSFRLGNRALGNPEGAAGLEVTLSGPALSFTASTELCLTGAPCAATVAGDPVPFGEPFTVPAGATLDLGAVGPPGIRTYLLVHGGLSVPDYLGSGATFLLGVFGGHGGLPLRPGDVLRPGDTGACRRPREPVPAGATGGWGTEWTLSVLAGPHADEEFFTPEDLDTLYGTAWEVHFNSARTGLRLLGPRPIWARTDGGEAGLHPSNIHDTPYSVGAVNFTGDLPILLGPDGPSLGGFVCPATVVTSERWKLGQLRPGDTVRLTPAPDHHRRRPGHGDDRSGVLARSPGVDGPDVTYRANGD
ncbi:MAG TPA: 5-oxoprolinase/urea amidolyase family protein, partial [Acidimicrobiales bacterium]